MNCDDRRLLVVHEIDEEVEIMMKRHVVNIDNSGSDSSCVCNAGWICVALAYLHSIKVHSAFGMFFVANSEFVSN